MRILMLGNSFKLANNMPAMPVELNGAEVVHHTREGEKKDMKIRTDFVTNSSSSSFSVMIKVETKNRQTLSYSLGAVDNDNEDIGRAYIEYRTMQAIKEASSIDDICTILRDAPKNCVDSKYGEYLDDLIENITEEEKEEWDEGPDYEVWEGHYKETKAEKEEFIMNIKKQCSAPDDILYIVIEKNYSNTGEYCECDPLNDSTLMDLAKKVHEAAPENRKSAINEFIEYIKHSNHFVLVDEDEAESIAENLSQGKLPGFDEAYSEIEEFDMKTKIIKKWKEYYL